MTSPPRVVDWGWAGRALEGDESGDLHVVVPFRGGAVVTLIDGLGHGPEAAFAARAAIPVLEQHASESVLFLIQRCHEALRKTRGAVMSVASFRAIDSSMTWIGVGNVEGVLLRAQGEHARTDQAIAARGGVVGYQLPALRAAAVQVLPGDTLIMTTDGVRGGFTGCVMMEQTPQEIADAVLARYSKGSDDAHVLVARYVGEVP
jgi:hypothetical protein